MPRSDLTRRIRRRARPLALWFTRSSHRELLTASMRPQIEASRGTVLDIGGGRDSPLAACWPARTARIRIDVSDRFGPDVLGDAQRLPIRTGSIDGAVLSEVLEHVPRPAVALAEIHRVLRPRSTLCGSVPFAIGIHANPHDYYRYTPESLQCLLSPFESVEIRAHGNHLGVAWRALNERWHWLWIINPLMRPLGRRTDSRWPVGYTFKARKAARDQPHPDVDRAVS